MHGDHCRLARIHQEDLLMEAHRVRLAREALGGRARREPWRRVLALMGTILIRIAARLCAGCREEQRTSPTARCTIVGSGTARLCHRKK